MTDFGTSLNPRVRGLGKSATLAINEKVADLRKKGRKIYSFGLGQSPFPVPNTVVEELKKNAQAKDYLEVQGLLELREAISRFHERTDSIRYDPDNILVGPGSKELMFLLQLCLDGEILIPAPSWVSYEPQAHIIGRTIHRIPTTFENRWLVTPEQLEEHCGQNNNQDKPKLLILNYPSNPCGVTYNRKQVDDIIKVARKHKLIILSDEIYSQIDHSGNHQSIALKYPEATILSSGLSKWCGAGGWRLGTFAFPDNLKWLLNAMAAVASETYTSVSAPIQYASIVAFNGNEEIDLYLKHSRKILNVLGHWIVERLRNANIGIHDVEGGFYILPEFSSYKEKLDRMGIINATMLSEFLLDAIGVATLPGSSFGMNENQLVLRMSYVDFDGDKALKAARDGQEINKTFILEHCPNVVEGINQLVHWLEAG